MSLPLTPQTLPAALWPEPVADTEPYFGPSWRLVPDPKIDTDYIRELNETGLTSHAAKLSDPMLLQVEKIGRTFQSWNAMEPILMGKKVSVISVAELSTATDIDIRIPPKALLIIRKARETKLFPTLALVKIKRSDITEYALIGRIDELAKQLTEQRTAIERKIAKIERRMERMHSLETHVFERFDRRYDDRYDRDKYRDLKSELDSLHLSLFEKHSERVFLLARFGVALTPMRSLIEREELREAAERYRQAAIESDREQRQEAKRAADEKAIARYQHRRRNTLVGTLTPTGICVAGLVGSLVFLSLPVPVTALFVIMCCFSACIFGINASAWDSEYVLRQLYGVNISPSAVDTVIVRGYVIKDGERIAIDPRLQK